MRSDPDRHRLLAQVCVAHAGLPHHTPDSLAVLGAIGGGGVEVLFDDQMPIGGGLTTGSPSMVVGSGGLLRVAHPPPDQLLELLLVVVHEGVHILDVQSGLATTRPTAAAADVFLTELRAYTAEYDLATLNGFSHLLLPDFRRARDLEDISLSVLSLESQIAAQLSPADESAVLIRVAAMFPFVPRRGRP